MQLIIEIIREKPMKRMIIIFLFLISNLFAQGNTVVNETDTFKVYKSGWYLGAGGSYPRYMTISEKSIASHNTHGFYLELGYNITEHFGFRLLPGYVRLHSFYYGANGGEEDNFTKMGMLNLEAIYSILPCDRITPFLMVGYGLTYFKSNNPYTAGGTRPWIRDAYWGYQALLGVGAEFKFWNDLSVKTEFDYITASNNKIDGNEHINEVKGLLFSNGDSYMNLKLGVSWYFSRGKRSKICEPMISIKEVIKEIPVEKIIVDTVYIDKVVEKAIIKRESFVLEKVRFRFNEDVLTKEAEIILDNVAEVMNKYPDQKFEITGHTDSIGDDFYNLDLSKRRANSVKNYLINKGVDESRLFTSGCGERKPVADNDTEMGRAINRRIEFSIYDGTNNKCPENELPEDTQRKNLEKAVISGEQYILEGVHFKFDSDKLTSYSEEILTRAAEVLNKFPKTNIEIQGHTDSLGNYLYNQFLSERRAMSVKNFLISKGVSSERLTTFGYGEDKPIDDNGTEYGKARNRRIEFRIISDGKADQIKIIPSDKVYERDLLKENEKILNEFKIDEERKIAESIVKGENLVFTNVRFEFDSDELTEDSKEILDNVVNVLNKLTDIKLEIQGHTDSKGNDNYNLKLSERRAKSVKNYLVSKGIDEFRFSTIGKGETQPIADNNSDEGRALNRRIEFIIVK